MAVPSADTLRARRTRFNLFVAFAFTIMADPVSSVAYAMEAALGALDGDLSSLFPTMAVVVGIIALVAAGYHGLIARFPNGGGGPEGLAAAFGEGWAFLPLGALLVDFTLTIAVSCAAGASALIAYVPELAGLRVPIALALVTAVGAGTLLGHRARVVFATATLGFVAATLVVLVLGAGAAPAIAHTPLVGDAALIPRTARPAARDGARHRGGGPVQRDRSARTARRGRAAALRAADPLAHARHRRRAHARPRRPGGAARAGRAWRPTPPCSPMSRAPRRGAAPRSPPFKPPARCSCWPQRRRPTWPDRASSRRSLPTAGTATGCCRLASESRTAPTCRPGAWPRSPPCRWC